MDWRTYGARKEVNGCRADTVVGAIVICIRVDWVAAIFRLTPVSQAVSITVSEFVGAAVNGCVEEAQLPIQIERGCYKAVVAGIACGGVRP